jgi:hypothetical protein
MLAEKLPGSFQAGGGTRASEAPLTKDSMSNRTLHQRPGTCPEGSPTNCVPFPMSSRVRDLDPYGGVGRQASIAGIDDVGKPALDRATADRTNPAKLTTPAMA